jgi:hypothetical protein
MKLIIFICQLASCPPDLERHLGPFGTQIWLETMLCYMSVFRLVPFGTPKLFETLLCNISVCTEPWFGEPTWRILGPFGTQKLLETMLCYI